MVETVSSRRARSPSGRIATIAPWGASFGIEWAQINRWDDAIRAASTEFDAPFERIKAHIVIESQGLPDAIQRNDTNGWSFGLMQVVPRFWRDLILRLAGLDGAGLGNHAVGRLMIDDPALAVRAGTGVLRAMADHPDAAGDWDRASSKFFLGNPDWRGLDTVNGNTGDAYRATLKGLIAEQVTAGGDEPSEAFEAFPAPRIFHVRQGVRATGRLRATREAPVVREFAAGTAVECDGIVRGQSIDGDDRWLRTSAPQHLAIHTSGLAEPI